jgi:hypothetical protein
MLQTVKLLGTYPELTFHAKHYYNAEPASNQPNYIRDGKVFVQKQGKKLINEPETMLISRAEGTFRFA